MNEHKKINELLVDFALGELSQEQASQVRTHLAGCPQCSSEIKRLKALLECTDRISKSSPDEQTCESTKQAILQTVDSQKIKQQSSGLNVSLGYIRKRIMKSPITKIAAAAVITIACVTCILMWTSTGSGIALADVLTKIEQVTGYIYQVNSTNKRREITDTRTSNVLVSKEYGIKMTITHIDPNSQSKYELGDEWFLLTQSNSIVIVSHKKKTYDRFIYDGVKLDFYKEQYNDPRAIIKQILSCEHKSLGQSIIDGCTVEGFQTTDLSYGGGFFGEADRMGEAKKVDVKLWVDVNTFLPVRFEENVVTEKRGGIHEVSYDFRWNVIVNPDDFEPNIPEDYRAPAGDIVIKPFNEENAIKGFKLFAGAFGKYPENLNPGKMGREYRTLSGLDPNSYKDMSDEERTRKTNEVTQFIAPSALSLID